MKKVVEKVLKTGYGLGLLSIGEAKRVVHTVKRDFKLGDLDKEESMHLARELVRSSGKVSTEVLNVVSKRLEMALRNAGIEKSDLAMAKRMAKKTIKKNFGWKESAFQKIKRKVSRKKRK